MSNQNIVRDLTSLHEEISKVIKRDLADFTSVQWSNPNKSSTFQSPSLQLEMVTMAPAKNVAGGRFAISLEIKAHCFLSKTTLKADLEIKNLAVKLMQLVNENRWELGSLVELPTEIGAVPSALVLDDKGVVSWTVSWKQNVHLGGKVEPVRGPAEHILISEKPEIGRAHKSKYQSVKDEFSKYPTKA